MYNKELFFVDNPLNRYNIGQRDRLISNNDGSIDIYIQHDSPGKDKETNWLPAPTDTFDLVMRLYRLKQAILDGSWTTVIRV